jgi:hypothetical protein
LRHPDPFEIRVFDETPRFTAYLVDGDGDGADGVAVVQSYLRKARGMEVPVIVLRGGSRRLVHQLSLHPVVSTRRRPRRIRSAKVNSCSTLVRPM